MLENMCEQTVKIIEHSRQIRGKVVEKFKMELGYKTLSFSQTPDQKEYGKMANKIANLPRHSGPPKPTSCARTPMIRNVLSEIMARRKQLFHMFIC